MSIAGIFQPTLQSGGCREETCHLACCPWQKIQLAHNDTGRLRDNNCSYGDPAKCAQRGIDLIEATHDLKLGLRERTVRVADRWAKLAEREFYVYLLLACLRRLAKGGEKADELFGWRGEPDPSSGSGRRLSGDNRRARK